MDCPQGQEESQDTIQDDTAQEDPGQEDPSQEESGQEGAGQDENANPFAALSSARKPLRDLNLLGEDLQVSRRRPARWPE
jgi:hypothetical protein